MSVALEIQDGSPWWLSPDIWTVPGDDPEGTPGLPVVGDPCYVWARVHNNGTDAVQDATVRFYWANPSVGFDRTTANTIGTASVSLDAGETQEVLCLVPWMPVFVNGGHECVLAEAFHPVSDPLPASPDFNVPTDRHVAQRNLSVVMAMKSMMFSMQFEIHNPSRMTRTFTVSTKPGRVEELKALLPHLGRKAPKLGAGKLAKVGFVADTCPSEETAGRAPATETVEVKPGARVGLSVVGKLEGESALLHVVQEADGKQVGGLSVLVLRAANQAKGKE